MKKMAFMIVIGFMASAAHANNAGCIKKADAALAKVAKTLGMGNGIVHIGGSEILKEAKDDYGNTVLTIGGGLLTSPDVDGYLNGTGATIEMVKTKSGCEVSSVSISTGADFSAAAQ